MKLFFCAKKFFCKMKLFLIAVYFMVIIAVCLTDHNISLLVMAPFPGELTKGWDAGPSLIPAARVAVNYVNNRTDILPGFNLKIIEANSGCSTTSLVTISFLRDMYENDQQVVGIIGPGCSGAALEVSNLTSRYEVSLIHITPSATTPELEDEARNTTFATISSALLYVRSFLELMAYNKWNRVATLQDEGRLYFKQTHSRFIESIDNHNKVVFVGSLYAGKQNIIPLDDLKSSRARVVIVFAGNDSAARLLCYAYHKDMLYPNYQWIFHDRTKNQLVKKIETFQVDNDLIGCSCKQMTIATKGVILNVFHLEQEDKDTILPLLQKTYNQYYKEDYKNELEVYRKEKKLDMNGTDPYGNTYHDAVWAMAIALHNASMNGVDLKSYTYNRNNDTIVIANYLSKVSFKGVSGPITFQNDTRSVKTIINIQRIWNGTDVLIGKFEDNITFFSNAEKNFISDSFEKKHMKVHIVVGIFTILLNVLLITITALLQIANIFWYSYRSIKATSPNLSHLVFSGCYLFAIAILLLTIQETFTFSPSTHPVLYGVFCNTFTWCLLLGYSLIFGTIFTKIWRVYRLFKHFQNKRPKGCLSDDALVNIVILLLFADIIICIMWNVTDPWMIQITETVSSGIPTLTVRSQCTCNHVTRWVVVVSLFKGLLMILVLAFSIMNRGIKRKEFEITKKLNILIYGITVIAGMGLPLYFLLKDKSIYIGFVVFFILLDTTVVLCCLTLFLPPVLPVIKLLLFRKRFSEEMTQNLTTTPY